jgi:hypothetical protein
MLRYDQHRELKPPQDATLELGPYFLSVILSESVGVQYITMDGSGVDFNTRNGRGRYLQDGFDIPIISTLSFNNYMLITRHMDFSFNIDVSYAYYPFNTQEDTWYVNMSDEGVFATFSTEIQMGRDMRMLLYDDILYRTDYVDTRGMQDFYGGEEYEHFENTVGADWDWMLTRFDNISASASRRDVISFSDNFDDQEGYFYNEMLAYQRQLTKFSAAGFMGDMSQSYYKVDERPDINMYGISAFLMSQLSRKIVGNASIGYNFSETPDGGYSTDSAGSLEASFGLGHQLTDSKYQELTYRRSQTEAFHGGVDVTDDFHYLFRWESRYFPGEFSTDYLLFNPVGDVRNSYSNWRTALNLRYQLTRRFQLIFDTSYDIRMNDPYLGDPDPDTPDINSDYNTWVIRLGTGTPISKKTTFEIYAEHADRTSDNEDMEYSQNAIVASLNWSHKF